MAVARVTVALGVAVVVAASLSGCAPVAGTSEPAPIAVAGGFVPPAPPAKPWQVVAVAAPATAAASASSTSSATRTAAPSGPAAASSAAASPAVQVGPCLPLYGPGVQVPVRVTARAGSAVLSWYHNGDPASLAYWIGVRPLTDTKTRQAVIRWIRVAVPAGCREMTATVPGIVSGTPYELWLDLESSTPETMTGVSRRTVNTIPVLVAK